MGKANRFEEARIFTDEEIFSKTKGQMTLVDEVNFYRQAMEMARGSLGRIAKLYQWEKHLPEVAEKMFKEAAKALGGWSEVRQTAVHFGEKEEL